MLYAPDYLVNAGGVIQVGDEAAHLHRGGFSFERARKRAEGIFDTMLGLVRRGLGGTAAEGRQYISWIHDVDFIRSVYWLIEHPELSGPVNLSAPSPMPNEDFMRILREAWGTSIGLPASRWMLEIGALLMRTETELVLKSRRVVPTRLLDSGFEFSFPIWEHAALDLCHRWRQSNQGRDKSG